MRIYSQGDSNVTSSGAPALLQNGTTMISIANRVIAIGYQSVIAVRRVKAQSRRVEASAFYKSTTLKRKPRNFLRSVLRSGKILMQNCSTVRDALRKQNDELRTVSNDMQSNQTLPNR